MKRIFFPAIFIFSLSASAQQPNDSLLIPVEVKAVRAAATAPFAKTNLSKKEIERQNLGQDLPFLLNQTPSVVVNADAGNGIGYTGIRIRGTDATRINMTLNGIPYNDSESQGLFFVNLPDFVSSVNNIQIQRGVGTSTNGAGAFGASLHLSTNEVNRKAYAEVNNSFGSFQTLKNTIKAGSGLLHDHFTMDLRLSGIRSNGYIDRATANLQSIYFSTAYLSDKTDLRLNMFSGKEKTYQAWNGVSESDLKNNRTINYAGMERSGEPYENETDNYRQDHYQFFITRRFSKSISFNTAFFLTRGLGYYEQYKAAEDLSDYSMPEIINGNDTINTSDLVRQLWLDNYFYGAIFSLQKQTEKNSLIVGGALSRYNGDHIGKVIWTGHPGNYPHPWYQHDAFKNDFNLYGKWQQYILEGLQVFADLQFRNVNYHLNGFRDNPSLIIDNEYHFLNPKLGLTYQKGKWLAYASYSVAGKEPNRDDFEAGLDQPKPEHLYDLETGIERRNSNSNLSVNFYHMKYKDQLVLTGKINDVGAYTRTNIPESYRLGLELQGGTKVNKFLRASGNISISRNKIKGLTEYIDDYDNGGQKMRHYSETDIAFSPSLVGAAVITLIPLKKLEIDLLGKYVGRQYLDNTSNRSRSLSSYFVHDFRALYNFSYKYLKNISLVLQVNNVLNKKYEPNGYTFSYFYNNQLTTENYYFPMAGRNWIAGLNIRL